MTPHRAQSPYLIAALLADVARMAAEDTETPDHERQAHAEDARTQEAIAAFGAFAYALRVSDAPRPE